MTYAVRALFAVALIAAKLVAVAGSATPDTVKNVVLVHGALTDGSGWRGVFDILTKDGYRVSVVQPPALPH